MISDADQLLAARFAATREFHDDGSWSDVLQRAGRLAADGAQGQLSVRGVRHRVRTALTRLTSHQRRNALAATAAVLVAAVLVTPAFGLGSRLLNLFTGGTPISTTQMSDADLHILSAMVKGVAPSQIPPSKQAELSAIGSTAIRKIAQRDGRAYFVIDKSDGSHCFAVGYVGERDLFGQIACQRSPVFPSPELPILDFAVFQSHAPDGMPTIWRLEGFAADGVASVGVVTANGALTAVTPVKDNVFIARRSALPTTPVRQIVAFAASGKKIYSQCLVAASVGGC